MFPTRAAMLVLALVATQPASAAKLVFLIGEYEYGTRETLPQFAARNLTHHECTFLHAKSDNRESPQRHFVPGMEAVEQADLLVISLRRRALPADDLERVRRHIAAGKGVVALRTATHAFSLRGEDPPPGHAVWNDFDTAVLGAKYEGHLNNARSRVKPHWAFGHESFQDGGKLYEMTQLADGVTVWATGRPVDETGPVYPIVWSRTADSGSRVFATTLGQKTDFSEDAFVTMLLRGLDWAAGEDE